MTGLDPGIQAPARLKLMTMLTAVSEAEFSTLRDSLDVSDSVLSKHVAALAGVAYAARSLLDNLPAPAMSSRRTATCGEHRYDQEATPSRYQRKQVR